MRRGILGDRLSHVRGFGEFGQHVPRFRRLLRHFDVLADAGERETPGLQMAGEGHHERGKLEFGLAQHFRRSGRERRKPIVARIETVGFRRLDAGNGGAGARVFDSLVEPKR